MFQANSWFQQPFSAFLAAVQNFMPSPHPQRPQATYTAARSRPAARTVVETPTRPQTPRTRQRTPSPEPLSEYSTPMVPDSAWSSQNFMLGAGMVIIQPPTDKVVIVYDSIGKYWFLPKGRKDLGESLEKTALREAYEESGYQVEFLPLHTPSCAPAPPEDPDAYYRLNTEPILVTLTSWSATTTGRRRRYPGEYLTSWYVGQIPKDAIYKSGTGMPNEQSFTSHLFTFDEAMEKLRSVERRVLRYAWDVYHHTIYVENERLQEENRMQESSSSRRVSNATSNPRRKRVAL